jgi:leucyl aminopeptidase (aminopeptidase T)
MELDAALLSGARNAARTCMNVGPSDRVFILTDDETLMVAEALQQEARAAGAEVVRVRLEEFGPRPMTQLPDALAERVTSFAPTVTFLALSSQPNELALRGGFSGLARTKFNTRHAHMPTITARQMREGMLADYQQVHDLTMRVYEIVRHAKTIRVTSTDGTGLVARFDESLKWTPCHGLYHEQGSGGNLPEGEVFTSPTAVEGVFVTRVLGDYFSGKYGVLDHPVRFEISDSHIVRVTSGQPGLAAEVEAYMDSTENGRRIGEFAIGTNTAVTQLCGSMLQDEKITGVHIAFGSPLGHSTGATWNSNIHVDIVCPGCSIEVDGKPLMEQGRFVLPPE